MAHDVFISYSSKDKSLADAVCAGLEAKGIRCWIAPRDSTPGKAYSGQLYKAIKSAKIFLILLTKNANLSDHVLREVELAIQSGASVIPFRTQNVPLSDNLKYYLSDVHWLDALDPPMEQHIVELANFINRLLGREILVGEDNRGSLKPIQSGSQKILSPTGKRRVIGILIGTGIMILMVLTGVLSGWFTSKPTNQSTPVHTLDAAGTSVDLPTITFVPGETFPAEVNIDSPIDEAVLVYVPAGEFTMGADGNDAMADEFPRHVVYLDAFWIGQTEVTNSMYAKCVTAKVCSEPAERKSTTRASYYGNVSFNDYPVVYVDWTQAQTYCAWAGARLPTEAEWEKAARGTDERSYPWGNEDPACILGNFDNCLPDTVMVGSYLGGASPYGALDMAGNVMEWTADWYSSSFYEDTPTENPRGPSSGPYKVVRGGYYGSLIGVSLDNFRSARRSVEYIDRPVAHTGFRCLIPDK